MKEGKKKHNKFETIGVICRCLHADIIIEDGCQHMLHIHVPFFIWYGLPISLWFGGKFVLKMVFIL